MRPTVSLLLASAIASTVCAQSNTIPGVDGRLTNNASPTYFGRRGAAHPNGEVGMSYSYTMCNPGTTSIAWTAPMNPNHPMFAYMIVRESNGRMEQVTNAANTFVKHAFGAANSASTCGGSCVATGTGLRVNCSDTYGASLNGDRFYLGPQSEIDPWTGIWNPTGSYFDRGEPDVGSPGNNDGARSPTSGSTGVFATDLVKNRVTIAEQDLLTPGRLFHCMHIVVRGEDGDLHFDNLGHRQFTASWNGSAWTFANSGVPFTQGSVLNQWAGATIHSARNGEDDGHFLVASKVTPISGGFHYEYAVHNMDNVRGGAALRIPVAAAATVTNLAFRDTDGNALNQWTMQRVGNEILFQAAANNPLDWNTIFNFSFDCTQAPSVGIVNIDQARPGAGSLVVSVQSDVPSGIPTAFNTSVGTGCAGGGGGPCQASVYQLFATPAAFDLANSSMGFTYTGSGYTFGPGSGTYTAPTGTTLPLTDDSEQSITLPFLLSYPGGTTTQLWVGSNGYVSALPNGTGFTPSGATLLNGNARWVAAWHDLLPANGSVLVSSSPAAVRISFTNVPTFGAAGGSHTFQYEFLPSNQVNIYWQTMTTTGQSYMAGWTVGHDPVDPGSSDLSAQIAAANLSLCTPAPVLQPLTLTAGSRPVLGTTVQMTTNNVPAGSGAHALVYGFTQAIPPIDLTPLGMTGCVAHMATFDVYSLTLNPVGPVVTPVTIPSLPSFVGVTATMQAATYSPPRTPFGWIASNGIVMFLAAQ